MNVLIWAASAVIVLAVIAVDVLRDEARQRREDRAWAEIRHELRDLEEESW